MPAAKPLTKTQLTLLLLIVSLVPPIFVVTMVATHKPPPEPLLECNVKLDVMVKAPRREPNSPRILPCVEVANTTDIGWRNVSVSLNKDFFFHRPDPLEPHGVFSVPLEFFVTKSGNVAFQPGSEKVTRVTVYAQIPTGARAIAEKYFDQSGQPTSPPSK